MRSRRFPIAPTKRRDEPINAVDSEQQSDTELATSLLKQSEHHDSRQSHTRDDDSGHIGSHAYVSESLVRKLGQLRINDFFDSDSKQLPNDKSKDSDRDLEPNASNRHSQQGPADRGENSERDSDTSDHVLNKGDKDNGDDNDSNNDDDGSDEAGYSCGGLEKSFRCFFIELRSLPNDLKKNYAQERFKPAPSVITQQCRSLFGTNEMMNDSGDTSEEEDRSISKSGGRGNETKEKKKKKKKKMEEDGTITRKRRTSATRLNNSSRKWKSETKKPDQRQRPAPDKRLWKKISRIEPNSTDKLPQDLANKVNNIKVTPDWFKSFRAAILEELSEGGSKPVSPRDETYMGSILVLLGRAIQECSSRVETLLGEHAVINRGNPLGGTTGDYSYDELRQKVADNVYEGTKSQLVRVMRAFTMNLDAESDIARGSFCRFRVFSDFWCTYEELQKPVQDENSAIRRILEEQKLRTTKGRPWKTVLYDYFIQMDKRKSRALCRKFNTFEKVFGPSIFVSLPPNSVSLVRPLRQHVLELTLRVISQNEDALVPCFNKLHCFFKEKINDSVAKKSDKQSKMIA
ncbi:uncharacterized protein K452DRAFT_312148 [Aplosporella prunicola CBS 121167]|uniref:Uncharacterized protein n=1 Tax=Aplosporella prunicola CBS 121167 TaxID=1176127 RepID=A0A6A6B0R6_9PEZI|nr:uncharacterized protein K452DRAFT_312148 [Aplosporella prunicola CBS 121167]KAF2137769.1 hypothetical protein K452DRAFT_312148 [Aplosporella prunicola CBS 121167]